MKTTVLKPLPRKVMWQFNMEDFEKYLSAQGPESKVYIGGDSSRTAIRHPDSPKGQKVIHWYGMYTTVVAIHIDGKHGCHVFGQVERIPDYIADPRKPARRLLMEVELIVEMFQTVIHLIENRHVEVHIDLNSKKSAVSNKVLNNAMGMVKSQCFQNGIPVEPMAKPNALAASFCADKGPDILKQASGK